MQLAKCFFGRFAVVAPWFFACVAAAKALAINRPLPAVAFLAAAIAALRHCNVAFVTAIVLLCVWMADGAHAVPKNIIGRRLERMENIGNLVLDDKNRVL